MELKEYFENTNGVGVLSTAGADGSVNAAIYSRPHVMDDGSVAMIMNRRLSHENVKANPHAHYLFIEDGPGHKGKRLALTMLREEQDTELLHELCRRCYPSDPPIEGKTRFLVFFRVDRELPLVGTGA